MEEMLPTQPIQPPTPPIVPEKKSNTGLIVTLIAILLIGVGGVYAGTKLSGKQISKPTPTIAPQPTIVPNETASWKTYTNTKYGYSVKYPTNFQVVEKGMGTGNLETAWGVAIRDINVKDPMKEPQISIEEVKPSSKTLKQLSEENYNANLDVKDRPATSLVNLHESKFLEGKAYEYTIKNNLFIGPVESFDGSEGEYRVLWFEHNDNIFMIMRVGSEIFDQILSTFKFTDQKTDETANWKTYTDSKYGFSFKYPETETLKTTNYTGYLSTVSLINTKTQTEDLVFYVGTRDESEGYKNDNNNKVSKAKIAGLDATRVSLPMGQNPPQELIFFTNAGKYYHIQFVWDGKDTESFTFFDQVLSTFKVLE